MYLDKCVACMCVSGPAGLLSTSHLPQGHTGKSSPNLYGISKPTPYIGSHLCLPGAIGLLTFHRRLLSAVLRAMGPFKGKLNNTLHRLNDRMKRHRSNDDTNAAHPKQPRTTLPTDASPSEQLLTQQTALGLGGLTPPSKPSSSSPSNSPASENTFLDAFTRNHHNQAFDLAMPSPAGLMTLDYTHQAPAAPQHGTSAPRTCESPLGTYALQLLHIPTQQARACLRCRKLRRPDSFQ